MKYCPQCGAQLNDDVKYCNYCGSSIGDREYKFVNSSQMPQAQIPKQQITSTQLIQPFEIIQGPTVELADFGSRLVSWIIDIIIISIIGSVISWIINPIHVFFSPLASWWWPSFFVNWLIGFLYYWILESQNQGQTIGKAAMHLRTVDERTLQVTTPNKYAINNILKPSVFILLDLFLGIIANLNQPEKRKLRYTQNLSETVVIKIK